MKNDLNIESENIYQVLSKEIGNIADYTISNKLEFGAKLNDELNILAKRTRKQLECWWKCFNDD